MFEKPLLTYLKERKIEKTRPLKKKKLISIKFGRNFMCQFVDVFVVQIINFEISKQLICQKLICFESPNTIEYIGVMIDMQKNQKILASF